MATFASGATSLGICDRCGLRAPLRLLVPDGYKKGLLVHRWCRDEAHPAEQPFDASEGIALKNPRPDRDDDSPGVIPDHSGTAQAGSPHSLTLAESASNVPNAYVGGTLGLVGGTGSPQELPARAYDAATKKVLVDGWSLENTGVIHSGAAQDGAADSLTLAVGAPSTLPADAVLRLLTGPGSVQERQVSAYDGTTKVATVSPRWRTNLLIRSEEFDNVAWLNAASTDAANTAVSPDGTTTADSLTVTLAAGYIFPSDTGMLAAAGGATYTYSVYVKDIDAGSFSLLIAAFDVYAATFNLSTLVISNLSANTTATITPVGDGWYRATIIAEAVANAVYSELQIGRQVSGSVYLWGAQFEKAADVGDYIKTVAAAITLPDATTGYEVESGTPDATTTYAVEAPDTLAEAMGFENHFGGQT